MKTQSKSTYIKIISVLTFLVVAFGIMTVRYALKANRYRIEAEIASQRAMNELCESLDSITVSLEKSLYTGTSEALNEIGHDLTRQASVAKMSLSELTDGDIITDEMYKFLSQIGEYTLSLCSEEDKLKLKADSYDSLSELLSYAESLRDGFSDIRSDYFDGLVSLEQVKTNLLGSESVPDTLLTKMQDAQQSLGDYPTLIYDGPFSDDILNREGGESLKNEREITKEKAKEIAADILGQKSESLKQEKDVESDIPLYCFSYADETVALTKKGGYIYYLLSPYSAGEETISEKEAVKRASEYLSDHGYKSMTESYYYTYDGVCTVNFAYEQSGVTCYSDLIKVSVALDKGEVVGLDAAAYLKNHRERELPKAEITRKQAEKSLADSLVVSSVKSALIPLDTGRESLCYEFHCESENGSEVLVYIDKQSGEQQELLLLLCADGGVLVK